MKATKSLLGWDLKRMCKWSLSWLNSISSKAYLGLLAIYSKISLSLAQIVSSQGLLCDI